MIGMMTGRRLLAALALALLVSMGASGHVGAERVPTGGDSVQRACRSIQDRYLALIKEYATATAARGNEIVIELGNLQGDWVAAGCKAGWGNVWATLVMPTTRPIQGVRPIGGIEVVDEPVRTPATGGAGIAPGSVVGTYPVQQIADLVDDIVVPTGGKIGGLSGETGSPMPILFFGEAVPVQDVAPVAPVPAVTVISVPADDQGIVTLDDPVSTVTQIITPTDDEGIVTVDDPVPAVTQIPVPADDQGIVTLDDPISAPVDDEELETADDGHEVASDDPGSVTGGDEQP